MYLCTRDNFCVFVEFFCVCNNESQSTQQCREWANERARVGCEWESEWDGWCVWCERALCSVLGLSNSVVQNILHTTGNLHPISSLVYHGVVSCLSLYRVWFSIFSIKNSYFQNFFDVLRFWCFFCVFFDYLILLVSTADKIRPILFLGHDGWKNCITI